MKLQTSLDPMSVKKTETPSASVVLRRRYGRSRFVIVAASWITVLNMFLQPLAALAGTVTWDANGATANQTDGAGAWLAVSKWWTGSANQDWISGDGAIFGVAGTAGGAVTLASPTTVNSLTLNSFTGTYTLGTAAQTITLNTGITINSTAAAVTIISPITLGGSQNWANGSASTFTVSGAVTGGANTLTLDGTGNGLTTLTGGLSFSGAGGLVIGKTGTLGVTISGGTITLGGTGGITINSGTSAVSLGAATVSTGQTWTNNSSTAMVQTGVLALGANTLTLGGGDFNFNQTNTGTGAINLNAGNLIARLAGAFGPNTETLTFGGGNLELRAAATTFTGAINMTAAGTTITINPATTGNGVTHIISGAATLGGGQTMVMSAGSLTNPNTNYGLTLSGAKTLTGNSTYTINGNGASGTGTLSLITGSIDTQGATRTLTFNSGANTGAVVLGGSFTGTAGILDLAGTIPTITVGSITGTANAIQVSGSGTYTFNGTSTFTGGVTINTTAGGIVKTTNATGLGPAANATVTFGANSTGKLQIQVATTIVGLDTNATPGTPIVENGSGTPYALTVNNTSNSTFAGVLQNGGGGTLALNKSGTGTLTLSGDNTYTGTTTVSAGKLILSGNNVNAITGTTTISGGVVQYNSLASINGTARNVTVTSPGVAAFGPAFGANIQTALTRIVNNSTGMIALTASSSEALDLSTTGANLTAAYLGTLDTTGSVVYNGTLTPNATAGYRLGGGGGTFTVSSALSGATALNVNGGAPASSASVLILDGNLSAYIGTITVSNGRLRIGANATLPTTLAPVTMTAGTTFDLNGRDVTISGLATGGASTPVQGNKTGSGSSTLTFDTTPAGQTFAGQIVDGGSLPLNLKKIGTNTQTLSANNTYTGSTTVNGGTLILSGIATTVGKLQNTVGMTIAGGGILQVGSIGNAVGENNLADQINTGATLTMGSSTFGGGTFRLALPANAANTYAHTQTLASLSLAAGANTINSINTRGASSTATLTLTSGTISRSVGGTIDFTPATGFGVVFGTAPTLTNSILGGYATCGYDWATVDGSKNLIPLASSANNNPLTWSATDNILVTGALANSIPTVTINSLRIIPDVNNGTRTYTIGASNTLTIGTGGILVDLPSSNYSATISGGTITSGGSELIIRNENSNGETFTIDSKISGAISLTQSGTSTLILKNGANEMGNIYVNAGTMTSTIQGALGPADDGAPTPTPYTIRLLGGNLSLTTNLQTLAKDIYFGQTGTITGSGALQTLTGNITATQTNVAGANNVTIAGDTAGVVLLKPASGKDVNIGGNLTVSSGGVALASTGELPAGNLNISTTGVLVLGGAGSDVMTYTQLTTARSYATSGANTWQFTSGGFAARGATVNPLPVSLDLSGVGQNFDRNFTLGSLARDANGNYYANAGVDISQNINLLTANRTIYVASRGPGLTGTAGAGVVNRISGVISGTFAPIFTLGDSASDQIAEIVLAGNYTTANSWTGSLTDTQVTTGPGGIVYSNSGGGKGGFIRFDNTSGNSSIPKGDGSSSMLFAMVSGNSSIDRSGFLLTGGVTDTTYALPSYARFLFGESGANPGGDTNLGSTGGLATLENSKVLINGRASARAVTLGLLVRDGALTLGSTAGAVSLIPTYGDSPTPTAGLTDETAARTVTKRNIGTVVLGNVTYTNLAGSSDVSSQFTWKLGSGLGVFDGAVRETATGTSGTNDPQTLSGVKAKMQGGVLEFGAAPRAIALGTAAGQIDMSGAGGGGFSAYDASRTVNIGGASATMSYGATSFVATATPLIFGSTTANNTLIFQNPLAGFSGGTQNTSAVRAIASVRGSGTTPEGELAGVLSNGKASGTATLGYNFTGMLKPNGTPLAAGSILLSNTNTYDGSTTITSGTILAGGNAPSSGNGVFGNSSGGAIILGGTRTTQTSVRAASTADFGTPTGSSGSYVFDLAWQAIDGVTLSAGDRVLCKDGSGTENGIYLVSAVNGMMRLTQQGTTTLNDQVQVTYGVVAAGRTYYGSAANTWSADTDQNVGLLTNGAYTIGRDITVGGSTLGTATIGGNTAAASTFSGNIILNKAVTLVAKAGGTVEFKTGTWSTNDKTVNIGAAGYTGTVLINNTLTTAGGVNVNAGTLGGTGTIGGSVTVNAGGTLAPGTGLGTETLTATSVAFANNTTAKLQVGLTSTTSDKLYVTGTATLTGATLGANLIGGGSLKSSYTVLTATGGVTGTFNNTTVYVNGEYLNIVYDGNDVKLQKSAAGTLILFK